MTAATLNSWSDYSLTELSEYTLTELETLDSPYYAYYYYAQMM